MIDKLVSMKEKDFLESLHPRQRVCITEYNNELPNMRLLTESEMSKNVRFTARCQLATEFKQICRSVEGESKDWVNPLYKLGLIKQNYMLSLQCYHYDDSTGYGVHFDHTNGKIYYFAFGCDHKFTELSQEESRKRGIPHWGNFCHVRECTECRVIETVDSSD